MTFSPGQLTSTDISPNANIQGTQIGDKTLTLRNFSDNILKIISEGTYKDTATHTMTNPGAGNFSQQYFTIATIPHGLNFTPTIIGDLNVGGNTYQPLPFTDYFGAGTGAFWQTWNITTDATNVVISLAVMTYQSSVSIAAGTKFKYQLLTESAIA